MAPSARPRRRATGKAGPSPTHWRTPGSLTADAGDTDAATRHLIEADPVLARLAARHPDFDPRAWTEGLPRLDGFGALVSQVTGQQLSVAATRRILSRFEEHFGGRMPSPGDLLASDPADPRRCGLSARKVTTLRAVAAEFASGSLSNAGLGELSDEEVEARLTRQSPADRPAPPRRRAGQAGPASSTSRPARSARASAT